MILKKEVLLKKGLQQLEACNYHALLDFFTTDASINCAIYGQMKVYIFFKAYFNDTLQLKITLKKIAQDPINSNNFVVEYAFVWTLKKGQVLSGITLLLLNFNSKNRVTYIEASHDLIELAE